MKILGIETSCDDTSAAVLIDGDIKSNIVSTQLEHNIYGGVIPEIASRAHQKNIITVIDTALNQAKIKLEELDGIAVTYGPGLSGPLLVGVNTAKAICFSKSIPLIPVNHIEGHIFANFIDEKELEPPMIVLVVSGGHTELYYMENMFKYEFIGKTRDDAAGECLDKVGKMMGLGFPAGKQIDDLAKNGDPKFHKFPRGLKDGFDFSFSGLKTSVKLFLEKNSEKDNGEFIKNNLSNICASFLDSVVDSLSTKLIKAAKEYNTKKIALAGGVSANSLLRNTLKKKAERLGLEIYYPPLKYCTDNGAMIAKVGEIKYKKRIFADMSLDSIPNLRLVEAKIRN